MKIGVVDEWIRMQDRKESTKQGYTLEINKLMKVGMVDEWIRMLDRKEQKKQAYNGTIRRKRTPNSDRNRTVRNTMEINKYMKIGVVDE